MSEHAIANARAWLTIICEQVKAMDDAQEAGDDAAYEAAIEAIQEGPLSLAVRGGWHSPGSQDDEPEEYEILLSTGGPALRIHGELSGGVYTADLEWQDWGTPWTLYADSTCEEDAAVLTYAQQFYFGD